MDGFFVVNIARSKENIVLPAKWIHKIEDQLEKFINNGANSNQPHLCFWTDNTAAYDGGIPNGRYEPNFHANVVQSLPTTDGCFEAYIVKYKSEC